MDAQSREFYVAALTKLNENDVPFLVGGAYAFARYTGIERHTKDFDIFIRREDYERAAKVLGEAGYKTDLTFPHWLGKAFQGEDFIDLIFSAGNGVAVVDEIWFDKAVDERVLDMPCKLIPPEEMIWSKGLIMERERFDGADVAHVIHALGDSLDWRRLIDRYAEHWRALYAHMLLFGYIYPSKRDNVPAWAMDELAQRLASETAAGNAEEKVCFGPVISRQQYLIDIGPWGYEDARLQPRGKMTAGEIAHWTAAIEEKK